MLAAVVLLAALQLPDAQGPRTLRAGAGQAYATPAAALAAARPGDTVSVAAGTYAGPLAVDRRVVLRGEAGAVLDGGGRGTVVLVTADSAEVHGFTVTRGGRSLDSDDAAIKLVRTTGVVVRGNRIGRSLHGVYLLGAKESLVASNVIHGDTALDEARRGNGVHLFDAHGNRVEGNVIRRSRDGIYFAGANGNLMLRNDIAHVRYGIHYMYSDDNEFRGNRLRRNAAGAAIMTSRRITLRDNTFAEHVGYRAYGILLQSAEDVVAEGNRIEGNLVGMFLDASVRNVFRRNAIVGNGIGIDLTASAEDNRFAGNAVAGNRIPVRRLMGAGANEWAEDGRGNWWGDPAVFDLDGDGIGERPYRAGDAFATLAAERPVLEVWAGTPAARALAWAEEAFPVFAAPRVEDPRPLAAAPAGLLRPGEARDASPAPRAASPAPAVLSIPLILLALLARARRRRTRTDER